MNLLNSYWGLQTAYFLAVFLVLIFLSLKKRAKPLVFSVDSTNELRGLAILGVIFAHICYGLLLGTNFLFPLAIWGGVAVNLFFLVSGFGLAASAFRRDLSIRGFYWRRLSKIVIPVWLSLLAFIALDAIFLKITYSWTEIWQSFLLFFPRADLFQSINSPLWFITPLVFFYLVFPLVFRKSRPFLSAGILIILSFLLTWNFWPVTDQVKSFYATHFLAFPLGVLLAVILNRFSLFGVGQKDNAAVKTDGNRWSKQRSLLTAIGLLALAAVAGYTALYSGVGKGIYIEQEIALVTTFAIMLIFIFKPIESWLLRFIGDNSLEIYLLHWPLMYRYDFFVDSLWPWLATLISLVLVIALAHLFKLFNKRLEKRWF